METLKLAPRRLFAAARPNIPFAVTSVLAAWLSWPVTGNLHPRLDLDGAWDIALRQAVHDGLDFGPEFLFTYGPLGFLREPLLVYPWTARAAFAYGLLQHVALCATLTWGLRRGGWSLPAAGLVTILLGAVIWQEPTLVIGFTAGVALVAGLVGPRAAPLLAAGLGAMGGIELLSKLNTGVTLGILGVVAVACAPWPRLRLGALLAGSFVAALVVGWAATGQSIAAVDEYVRGSLEVVSGYSEAMWFEDPITAWEYWAALIVTGVGFAVVWHAGAALPRRAKVGLLALWSVVTFMTFKAGFVRHDPVHTNIFFATALGALVAFSWAPHRRRTAGLVGVLVIVTLFASLREDPLDYVVPFARVNALVDQALLLTDGSATNDEIAEARSARAAYEQIDLSLVAQVSDGAVHVEPAEAGLVWAHRLRWRPLPVFQTYSAYTNYLDERNAAALRDPRGPDNVFRETGNTFDSRNPAWDSPAAMRELLCQFRGVGSAGRWLLLERTRPRCERPRALTTIRARLNQAVPVPPAPDDRSVVFVRVSGLEVTGLERLRSAVFRAHRRGVQFDDGRVFRVIPGTAEGGLILRVPKRADHPPPFTLDQSTETLTFTRGTDPTDDEIQLHFYAMTIR